MKERPPEEWIKIEIPAIISEDQFERAQQLLVKSRRLWAGWSKTKYLLSGLVRCECGNTMTGKLRNNWGKKVRYYTCFKNTAGTKNPGCGRHVNADLLEEEVWNRIKAWIYQPEEIAKEVAVTSNKEFYEQEVERLEKEINKAREGRKKLIALLVDTDLDTEEVRDQLLVLKDREEKLMKELEQIKERLEAEGNNEIRKHKVEKIVESYMNKDIDTLEFEERQILVRQLIEQILVTNDGVDIYTV
jgi:site-specific DNA recombinase